MSALKLQGVITKEQLEEAIRNGDVDTVIIAICDMQGRLMGKRLTGDFFLESGISKGTHFCKYLLGTDMEMNTPEGFELMNWENGYGDWLAKPDWSTLRIVPWLEKTALVLADSVDEKSGELIPIAPRSILKNQLKKAEEKGFCFNMVSELEFYLFKESYEEIHQKGYRDLRSAGHYNEDYNLLQASRNEPIYRTIRQYMNQYGIPIESSKGEAYSGQHEINMCYSDALTSADRHVLFKHGAKEICMQNNYSITFMAKPFREWTGSSGHMHISMWDRDYKQNLFYDPQGELYHMSEYMQQFLAGLISYTRDFSLFFASNINSYKRYALESWAPVYVVWSYDNRTAGFRIVGDKQGLRIESRIPGADINPYLAYSAMISAGLHGIENKLTLPDELKGNAYALKDANRVPFTLNEAAGIFNESPVVRELLGDQVVNHYVNMAKVEQQMFDQFVTDWERTRYFEQG